MVGVDERGWPIHSRSNFLQSTRRMEYSGRRRNAEQHTEALVQQLQDEQGRFALRFEKSSARAIIYEHYLCFAETYNFYSQWGQFMYRLQEGGIWLDGLAAEQRVAAIQREIRWDGQVRQPALPGTPQFVPFPVTRGSPIINTISYEMNSQTLDQQCGVSRHRRGALNPEGESQFHHATGSMMVLTRPCHLHRFSVRTGRKIFSVTLDGQRSYTSLGWNRYGESMVAFSAKNEGGINFVIFGIEPYRLLCKGTLNEHFPKNSRISFQDDLAYVVDKSHDRITVYSLAQWIKDYSIIQPIDAMNMEAPYGYQDTLLFHEAPRPLYEFKSKSAFHVMGGPPYILIRCPREASFHISTLLTDTCLSQGVETEDNAFHSNDMYYYDNHFRILMQESHRVRIFRVTRDPQQPNDEQLQLTLLYEINSSNPRGETLPAEASDEASEEPTPAITSSGRKVKVTQPLAENAEGSSMLSVPTIVSVEYEDDLDLLVVAMRRSAFLYRNCDGSFVREIPLGRYWVPSARQSVILDKTQLIILTSHYHSSVCSVHVLDLCFPSDPRYCTALSDEPHELSEEEDPSLVVEEYAYDSDYVP